MFGLPQQQRLTMTDADIAARLLNPKSTPPPARTAPVALGEKWSERVADRANEGPEDRSSPPFGRAHPSAPQRPGTQDVTKLGQRCQK